MSKTTTPEQYEKLVDFMVINTDIAGGLHTRPKESTQAFWEEVRRELNAIGPPSKDVIAWKKVWIDWKSYIKRKLTHNTQERMSTGGGECRLQPISALEERVIQLTGLVTSTSGIRSANDYGVATSAVRSGQDYGVATSAVQEETRASAMDISLQSEGPVEGASCSRRRPQEPKSSTAILLKELFNKQEGFNNATKNFQESVVKTSDDICTYLRRINRNVERLADTAEQQLAEDKRHNKFKEDLLRAKIQLKMQMLKLQYPEYDREEKRDMGGSPSNWRYYDAVHKIIGSKASNTTPVMESDVPPCSSHGSNASNSAPVMESDVPPCSSHGSNASNRAPVMESDVPPRLSHSRSDHEMLLLSFVPYIRDMNETELMDLQMEVLTTIKKIKRQRVSTQNSFQPQIPLSSPHHSDSYQSSLQSLEFLSPPHPPLNQLEREEQQPQLSIKIEDNILYE